jgi:hypothetical protein
LDGHKEVGAGGAPGRAVLGETTAGHHGRDGGGSWSCRPHVCSPPGNPGRAVPMTRSSAASR